MTRILLVRHGQSTWNAAGRWQGQADPPLSQLGEQQARQAALVLGAFDALVASPLQRALRTAEIIGAELGIGPVEIEHDLAERAVGPWTGLTFPDIEAGWPGALERREFPDGFEDDDTLISRTLRALTAIESRLAGATLLAVSHGGVLHALERALGVEGGRFGNLTGRWLILEDGKVRLGDRVALTDESTGGDGARGPAAERT